MKTTFTILKKAVVALCIMKSVVSNAQVNAGFNLSRYSTGSGFGATYAPGINISTGKHAFDLALNVQERKMNVSGGQLTYAYTIFNGATDKDICAREKWELFLFLNATYNPNSILGNHQIRTENKVATETTVDFTRLRFSSMEGYVGFGANLRITDRFKWTNAIGIGGWNTLKGQRDLYREYSSMSLYLKTGFSFSIN
jgi:hypothetical protein